MTRTFLQYAKHNRIAVWVAATLAALAVVLTLMPGDVLPQAVASRGLPEMRLLAIVAAFALGFKLWREKIAGTNATWSTLSHLCTSRVWLAGLFAAALALFIYAKLTQHFAFYTHAYDLSMYDYALSNTLKGDFMYTPMLGRNFFSEHFAPILFLLLPLYAMFDTPTTLVVVQAVAIVAAVIPLYKLGREVLGSGPIAVLFCILFLAYDPVIDATMFDFHMEIFEPFLMFSAFLAIHRKQFGRYTLFALLALSCKEDMPIYFVLIGVYIIVAHKNYLVGLGTIVVSAAWLFVALQIIIPASFPDGYQQSIFLEQRWGNYGSTAPEIVATMVREPWRLVQGHFAANVYRFFGRLGFVGFTSPIALLSLPVLLLNSTVSFELQAGLTTYYSMPYVPIVFVSSIYGLRNVRRWVHDPLGRWLLVAFAAVTLIFNVTGLPSYTVTDEDREIRALLQAIPPMASVSAQTTLTPHLPKRVRICTLPKGGLFEYVLFDTQRNRWPLLDDYDATVAAYHADPFYELAASTDRFLMFERKPMSALGPFSHRAVLPILSNGNLPRTCH